MISFFLLRQKTGQAAAAVALFATAAFFQSQYPADKNLFLPARASDPDSTLALQISAISEITFCVISGKAAFLCNSLALVVNTCYNTLMTIQKNNYCE